MHALLFALTLASSPLHQPLEIPLGASTCNVWPKFEIVGKRPGHATLWLYDVKRQATIYDITVK